MESYALIAQFDNMFSDWVCPTLSAPENYKKNPFIDSIFFYRSKAFYLLTNLFGQYLKIHSGISTGKH